MAVFTCVLKADHGKLKKGTTIQVSTNMSTPDQAQIAAVLEKQFGKETRGVSYKDYWIITKNC